MKYLFLQTCLFFVLATHTVTANDLNKEQLRSIITELNSLPGTQELCSQLNKLHNGEINVNALYNGKTILDHATELGEYELAAILLKMGADPNIKSRDTGKESSSLLRSIDWEQWEIARLLIESGANVNATYVGKDKTYWTSLLMDSIHYENDDICRLLIEKGADVNKGDSSGATPLIDAAQRGNTTMVRYLIKKQANVNAADIYGDTALQSSMRNGCYQIARILIENGADVRTIDSQTGDTLLHRIPEWKIGQSYENDLPEAIKTFALLIARGLDVNAENKIRRTPLLMIIGYLSTPVEKRHKFYSRLAQLLIQNNADPLTKLPDGRTAADIIRSYSRDQELIRLIDDKAFQSDHVPLKR